MNHAIITLCGSARFEPWFVVWNEALTLCGNTVFSLTVFPSQKSGVKTWYTDEEKDELDKAHFRKIERSSAILVLNAFGYLGTSTLREIEYATALRRDVYYLESWGPGFGVTETMHTPAHVARAKSFVDLPTSSPIETFQTWWDAPFLPGPGAERTRLVDRITEPDLRYPHLIPKKEG